jgi:deoxycytidine triphosphate deaminase
MYLSDRDLRWALDHGQLLVLPRPEDKQIGPTSIDLHLDKIEEAKIWNIPRFCEWTKMTGHEEDPELPIGPFDYTKFAREYLIPPSQNKNDKVFRRGNQVIVKPHGFVLWQTKEKVGTPEEGAQLICFIDGKSTKARTGILVHMTAPHNSRGLGCVADHPGNRQFWAISPGSAGRRRNRSDYGRWHFEHSSENCEAVRFGHKWADRRGFDSITKLDRKSPVFPIAPRHFQSLRGSVVLSLAGRHDCMKLAENADSRTLGR